MGEMIVLFLLLCSHFHSKRRISKCWECLCFHRHYFRC